MSKPKVKQYTANELRKIGYTAAVNGGTLPPPLKSWKNCEIYLRVAWRSIARHVNAELRKAAGGK